jgi:trehalose 6-phosphate synthase
MRFLSVRLIASLILAVALVSLLSSYYQVNGEKRNLRKDLERRAAVLSESFAGNVEAELEKQSVKNLQDIVERFSNREHLAGVAVLAQDLSRLRSPPISRSAYRFHLLLSPMR